MSKSPSVNDDGTTSDTKSSDLQSENATQKVSANPKDKEKSKSWFSFINEKLS